MPKVMKIVLSIFGLLAVVVFLSYRIGECLFDRKVREEVRALADAAGVLSGSASTERLETLPEPVRRYFRYVEVQTDSQSPRRVAGATLAGKLLAYRDIQQSRASRICYGYALGRG